MDRLQAMQTFVKVIEMNSFSRAADVLGMPRASVTTVIKNLEGHLKVNLMHRTTRKLSLTPEGSQYYELCVRILSDIRNCEESLTKAGDGPRGELRVDMPGAIGRLIVAPRIMEFRANYPDIDLILGFSNRPTTLATTAIDCAIRSGCLRESSYLCRPLGKISMLTVASPGYLEQHGTPEKLDDLETHLSIDYCESHTGRIVEKNFMIGHVPREVGMKRSVLLSDIEAGVVCSLAGAGIVQAPQFMLQRYLEEGLLEEILPQWRPRPIPVSAQYASDHHLGGKVRVFVEWIANMFLENVGIDCSDLSSNARSDTQSFNQVASSL
ncbi:LysR family transcriptional regulator [Paraburkholderia bengalensis]|uniref:LysR family transcriptional regulator n=1 Tax=Paraburkholderia bengalensis TaxID=2747562 RepID=A0ABU8J1X0_9BURK